MTSNVGMAGAGVMERVIAACAETENGSTIAVEIVAPADDHPELPSGCMVMVQIDEGQRYVLTVPQARTLADFWKHMERHRPDLAKLMGRNKMLGLSRIMSGAADEAENTPAGPVN